jgi:hypothetical protein
MSEIVVLTKDELAEVIEKTALAVTEKLREDLQKARTPELMTKDQVATYLHCHPVSINRFMDRGLPYEQFGDLPRFRKTDIDRWLKSNKKVSKNGRLSAVQTEAS